MSSRNVKDPQLFDLKRLLSSRFAATPAWRDLADVTTQVLNTQVHRYRRSIQKIRDSQQFRVGDVLPEIWYDPADPTDYPLDESGNPVPLVPKTKLANAKIKAIEQFASNHGEADTTDYIIVEFVIADGRTLEWKMPIDVGVHQEKSILIANASMLGFDFMAKGLSPDDYRRLYDFVSQYWPEGGTENFVRFMAFVKDIRLSLEPLWSVDDDTDTFPFLEPKRPDFIPAWKGGDHYQTSHVELRYYPRDIENINDLSMEELKDLFYYMAPIHLVLERIVGVIEQDFDIFVSLAGQEFQIMQAKHTYKSTPGTTGDLMMHMGEMSMVFQSHDYWEAEILRADIGYQASGQEFQIHQTYGSFVPGESDSLVDLEHAGFPVAWEAKGHYRWVAEHLLADPTFMSQGWAEIRFSGKENYISSDYSLNYDYVIIGRTQFEFFAKINMNVDAFPLLLEGWISDFVGFADSTFLAKYRNTSVPFPELQLNAIYMGGFGYSVALILGTTVAADPVNPVFVMQMNSGRATMIFQAKVIGKRVSASATA